MKSENLNAILDKSGIETSSTLFKEEESLPVAVGDALSVTHSEISKFLIEEKSIGYSTTFLNEGVVLTGWKNVENISARLLEYTDDIVVVECLLDRETRMYEEIEYKRSFFKNFDLKIGMVFKLCFYERGSQVMMDVKGNPKLVLEDDFPKIDFTKLVDTKKFFNKKK